MRIWRIRGGRRRKGRSQQLYRLGSVYLAEYQIYTPIRWKATAPPASLHSVWGHVEENGCRQEGVLSNIFWSWRAGLVLFFCSDKVSRLE